MLNHLRREERQQPVSIFDTRAFASGFAGACLLALLDAASRPGSAARRGKRRALPGMGLLANSAYFALVSFAARPVTAGALLGTGAGIGAVLWGKRQGQSAAASIALCGLAGVTAGAAYQALTSEGWPSRDWDEAFFP